MNDSEGALEEAREFVDTFNKTDIIKYSGLQPEYLQQVTNRRQHCYQSTQQYQRQQKQQQQLLQQQLTSLLDDMQIIALAYIAVMEIGDHQLLNSIFVIIQQLCNIFKQEKFLERLPLPALLPSDSPILPTTPIFVLPTTFKNLINPSATLSQPSTPSSHVPQPFTAAHTHNTQQLQQTSKLPSNTLPLPTNSLISTKIHGSTPECPATPTAAFLTPESPAPPSPTTSLFLYNDLSHTIQHSLASPPLSPLPMLFADSPFLL